jgi:ribosomal protein L16 Arg81 hydroxylase
MRFDKIIDIVDSISYTDFIKKYYQPQRPVIIRKGIVENQPECLKWSLNWFKEHYGHLAVPVFDNKNQAHKKSAVTKADIEIPFAQFIEHIQTKEVSFLRMFLFNLFKSAPELQKDFNTPEIMKGILGKMGFAFFGGKNTEVKMHYDVDMSNVLLTQFEGRKRVLLFEPKYSKLLYRTPLNMHSLVDIDNPNYDHFPGLKYVNGYHFVMQAGDSLFMPSGYWHYNTYLEPGFAIAYRKIAPSLALKLIGFSNIAIKIPLDKLLLFLFKDRWFKLKNKIAHYQAERAIQKLDKPKKSLNWA